MSLPWLETVIGDLDRAIVAGRLGHAPLIHGAAGSGKRALAAWLVRRFLCEAPRDGGGCGECNSCRLIEAGTHPDLFVLGVLEDKTAIVVDQVREFCGGLALTPARGPHRVGLIDPAERMNEASANALLKTLEEPADNAWIVLVTDQPERLPATVRSRCQRIGIRPPDAETGLAWLAKAHPGTAEGERQLALELAGGAPLLASAWLESGGLDDGRSIGRHLVGPDGAGNNEASLAEEWSADPAATWDWLARWSAALMRWRIEGGPSAALDALGAVAPGTGSTRALERCWLDALEGRRMSAAPVRHDLLLRRWLLQFREANVTTRT